MKNESTVIPEGHIDISKFEKADVLIALYNNAKQQGMGFLNPLGRDSLSKADATSMLKKGVERPYFDYLRGRVMKVEIAGDSLNPFLYDRDNGKGAAARALSNL